MRVRTPVSSCGTEQTAETQGKPGFPRGLPQSPLEEGVHTGLLAPFPDSNPRYLLTHPLAPWGLLAPALHRSFLTCSVLHIPPVRSLGLERAVAAGFGENSGGLLLPLPIWALLQILNRT